MEFLQLLLFLIVFFIMALAMFFRKIPALLALPIIAFLMPLIAGVSITDTIQFVLGEGSVKLHTAYTVAIFGSMLSVLLQKTGVAENFIKKGAELAGDNPWVIAVIMLTLITLLFTTLGGLGAIIMVATVVLPVMTSVGIGQMTVVGIFLIGLSMGGILNAGNWALYKDVMQLTVSEIRPFALVMFGLTFICSIIYITVQLYRDGHDLNFKNILRNTVLLLIIFGSIFFIYINLSPGNQELVQSVLSQIGSAISYLIAFSIILLFILSLIHALKQLKQNDNKIYWTAYFTPIIPLFLILLYDMNFIAAFICGLLFGFLATFKKGSLNTFVQSVLEGGGVVMPAVALMLGIGMLLIAIMGPQNGMSESWPVLTLLQPLLAKIIPTNAFSYVLIFTILAPLALYRGPLNVWGMGYGLAAVFLASGLNAGAIMGLLISVGQIQGISDPTNTHNIWLANEMQQDVQKVLWNTIPYTWILAFFGLTCAAIMFM